MKLYTNDANPTDILEFDPNVLWYIMVNAIKELKAYNEKKNIEIEGLQAEISEIKSYLKMQASNK